MSFLRHRKIYPDALTLSTLGSLPTPASHRNEFSAGYSLASCTPALLASGSPASLILQPSVLPVDIIAANGNLSPFTVYQPRGPLHTFTGTVNRFGFSPQFLYCSAHPGCPWQNTDRSGALVLRCPDVERR